MKLAPPRFRVRMLLIVVAFAVTLLIILLLLYLNFGRLTETFIVMLSLPFSLIGGLWFVLPLTREATDDQD